jgi:AraC-like DNA-binding protein
MMMPASEPSELVALIARTATHDGAHDTPIPGLAMTRASAPSDAVLMIQEPCLCLIAQGKKRVALGTEELLYAPDRFLMVSVGVPITGRVVEATPERPYLGIRLEFDPTLLASLVVEVDGGEPSEMGGALGISVGQLEPALRDAMVRLLRLLDTPRHIPMLAPLIQREILVLLLLGPEGGRLRDIARHNGHAYRIARAIDLLRRDYARPIRVEEIAREVGMSVSGLHHHFKAVTAMSPLQFQKRLRLQEARRLMLGEGMDAAGAAFQVGYESPSQFSREYRRLFGAPPRQDVTRIRESGGLAVA